MKFMATWSIAQDQWLPILKKFTSMSPQEQKNAGSDAPQAVASAAAADAAFV